MEHDSPSSSVRRKLSNLALSPGLSRSRKRRLTFDDASNSCQLHYEPQLFLRCHAPKNDPNDCTTQSWAAAFEPDVSDNRHTTDIVATCGGNIVCFINCSTGHILKRYKSDVMNEDLFTLAWTVMQVDGNSPQKTTVLATGGAQKKIYLIHPSQLKCYLTFKAHSQAVNCLQFHSSQKTWLFSGGADKCIHLWDIGTLMLPTYKSSYKKLFTFEAQSDVVQLAISDEYNCLFAATEKGLRAWAIHGKPETWTRSNSVTLLVPESCTSGGSSQLVDGLTLVAPHCLGVKVSHSGKVFLSDISRLFQNGKLLKKPTIELSVIAVYLWSDSNSDYNYIGSSLSGEALACGDNSGCLWVYNMKDYTRGKKFSLSKNVLLFPDVILPWPCLRYEKQNLPVRPKIIVNSVAFNWNAEYLIACTDTNLICIWKRQWKKETT